MTRDTQQPANERQDADDANIQDPAYAAGFDELENPPAAAEPKEKKGEKADQPAAEPPEPEKPASDKPQDPPPDPDAEKPQKPATPPTDPQKPVEPAEPAEPESALAKAEAAGAKLTDPQEPAGDESVADALSAEDKALVQSAQFAEWFNRQKPHVQKMGSHGGIEGALTVLDFYKSAQAAAAPKPQTAAESTKQLIAEFGDVPMRTASGETVTLSEYLKEYGDLGEAIAVIADKLASKRVPAAHGAGEPDRIAKLEGQLSEMRFWEAVTEAHADGRKISRSPEFKEWAKTATPAVQRLLRSGNPDHAVIALDAYKEFRVEQAKSKTTTVKDRTVALHGDTVRGPGRSGAPARRQEDPDADFDSGFSEGAK